MAFAYRPFLDAHTFPYFLDRNLEPIILRTASLAEQTFWKASSVSSFLMQVFFHIFWVAPSEIIPKILSPIRQCVPFLVIEHLFCLSENLLFDYFMCIVYPVRVTQYHSYGYYLCQWSGCVFTHSSFSILQLVNPNNKAIRDIPGLAPPAMSRKLLWDPIQESKKNDPFHAVLRTTCTEFR